MSVRVSLVELETHQADAGPCHVTCSRVTPVVEHDDL